MSTLTSPGEDILFIREEPAPQRRPRRWGRVTFRIVVAGIVALVVLGMTLDAVHTVRMSRRGHCADNLRRIGLASIKYAVAHDHLPAPTIARRDGTPLLSWRVALLPDLGYQSLFDRFHLDEPWDSPHNLALLAEMPPEFACPGGAGRRSGRTGYVVIVGPKADPWSVNTPFEPTRGVDVREITDGTSSTVLVLETDAPVPWTRPDDLRWAPGGPLPNLASPHPGGANAVFVDGTIRFLKATIGSETLRAILTINGGELSGG